jgi:sugar transferase (PEP-CTERM/EpsH1 system associated)
MSSTGGLRILIVSPHMPSPPTWGFAIRIHQMVRWLAVRDEVTVLCFLREGQAEHAADLRLLGARVHTVPAPVTRTLSKRAAQLASVASRSSYASRMLYAPAMQSAMTELVAQQRFDVVQIESSHMSCYAVGAVPALVLDEHNLESEVFQRMCRAERSLPRRLFNGLEYRKVRREELRCWRRFDGCILTSERESTTVHQRVPSVTTAVVPNGVDLEYFHPSPQPAIPDSLVFTGLMRYRPNLDAVQYFVREVLPLLQRVRPGVRLTVVGSDVPAELARLAGPSVVITGRVPDVRPYLAAAAAVVVPLRMGGGTRLKVLEALAMGRAVVSTSIGCEGLRTEDGVHLLTADDPRSLAERILLVLSTPSLAEELGRRGRLLVEASYGWEMVVDGLRDFHQRVLGRRPGTGTGRAAVPVPSRDTAPPALPSCRRGPGLPMAGRPVASHAGVHRTMGDRPG